MNKSYDEWWALTKGHELERVLAGLGWPAEKIIRCLFYKKTQLANGSILLERRTNEEIAYIEQEYHKAILRYEEEFKEPFIYSNWYDPYEAFEFYDDETEDYYQSFDVIWLVISFLTVKELFEYIKEYDSLSTNEQFTRFKEIAALILNTYTHLVAESERADERLLTKASECADGKLIAEEIIRAKARKAGLAKKSPYEKAGTIKAVHELLEEKQALLVKRGGKAALNRMILDLVASSDIPAPSTPSAKTVDLWIDAFKKSKQHADLP